MIKLTETEFERLSPEDKMDYLGMYGRVFEEAKEMLIPPKPNKRKGSLTQPKMIPLALSGLMVAVIALGFYYNQSYTRSQMAAQNKADIDAGYSDAKTHWIMSQAQDPFYITPKQKKEIDDGLFVGATNEPNPHARDLDLQDYYQMEADQDANEARDLKLAEVHFCSPDPTKTAFYLAGAKQWFEEEIAELDAKSTSEHSMCITYGGH